MKSIIIFATVALAYSVKHSNGILSDKITQVSNLKLDGLSILDLEELLEFLEVEELVSTGQLSQLRELKLVSDGMARVSPNDESDGSFIDLFSSNRRKRSYTWYDNLIYIIPDDCQKEEFGQENRISTG